MTLRLCTCVQRNWKNAEADMNVPEKTRCEAQVTDRLMSQTVFDVRALYAAIIELGIGSG